ncbi:MAG TPA: hypothetical protein VFE62_02765, partial [Gemmataceae bacterium]|nr:hypothetical protein [Gemmataceae bacterium]
FLCNRDEWDNVARNLRSHRANYFRLGTEFAHYLVISTLAPTSANVIGVRQVDTDDAAEQLCRAIETLTVLHKESLTHSKPWKLIEEDKNTNWQGWRRIAKIDASQEICKDILLCHRVDWKIIRHAGQFWSWRSWQFTDRECDDGGGYARVYGSLQFGEVLPDVDVWGDTGEQHSGEPPGVHAGGGVWFNW